MLVRTRSTFAQRRSLIAVGRDPAGGAGRGRPRRSSPTPRGRCSTMTCATPARVRSWAPSSRPGRRRRPTSRSGTASTGSGPRPPPQRRRQRPVRGPRLLLLRHRHGDDDDQLVLSPPRRRLRLLARHRQGRHHLRRRPGQYVHARSTRTAPSNFRRTTGTKATSGPIRSSPPPACLAAGTIYYAHDQSFDGFGVVTAMTPGGTIKWKYVVGTRIRKSSPAIGKDGVIYFGDLAGVLHAFRTTDRVRQPTRSAARASSCGRCRSAPRPRPERGPRHLGGLEDPLYRDGNRASPRSTSATIPRAPTVRWIFPTAGKVDQTPALATDGTLYVPAMSMSQKRLYALNPRRHPEVGRSDRSTTGSENSAYPIVGADGVIYLGLDMSVYALSPAGNVLWTYATTNFIMSYP